jgi:hypothetical protein
MPVHQSEYPWSPNHTHFAILAALTAVEPRIGMTFAPSDGYVAEQVQILSVSRLSWVLTAGSDILARDLSANSKYSEVSLAILLTTDGLVCVGLALLVPVRQS